MSNERMDVEDKLDKDFLFYLGFTNEYFLQLESIRDKELSEAWLLKLCGGFCHNVKMKRCRNLYLSNLLICMKNGRLKGPFRKPPNEVDISDAIYVFGPCTMNFEELDRLCRYDDDEDYDNII